MVGKNIAGEKVRYILIKPNRENKGGLKVQNA